MRNSSDRDKRLQGALAAVDDALFRTSPKQKFDLDRTDPGHGDREPRAIDLNAMNQRFQQLDEYYSRAVAELKASLDE
jgi:hypothetical protein